jgi:hypothetical protein
MVNLPSPAKVQERGVCGPPHRRIEQKLSFSVPTREVFFGLALADYCCSADDVQAVAVVSAQICKAEISRF